MNYTQNYKLNQWEASDRVLRTDFNADNAKIDAALAKLESGKADASALTAFGNCLVEYGTYVGTGVYGNSEDTATILRLGYRPKLLVAASGNGYGLVTFLWPCPTAAYLYGAGTLSLAVRWMEDGLQWNPTAGRNGPDDQLNAAGVTYYYAAFR